MRPGRPSRDRKSAGQSVAELHACAASVRSGAQDLRGTLGRNVQIPVGDSLLEAQLTIPPRASALVVFVHGSGSGRLSRRNRYLASELQAKGFATLLFDLLSPDEEVVDAFTAHLRFDMATLTARLVGVTDWVRHQSETSALGLGYFGASAGTSAALAAAVERPEIVHAIVSRGGRPAVAELELERVKAPTLLVVGDADPELLAINRAALARLRCEKALEVIVGASHLFEEPGALEAAARVGASWFTRYLVRLPSREHPTA